MYKVHRGRVLLQKVPLGLAKVHGRVDFFWLLSTLKGCVLGIFANPTGCSVSKVALFGRDFSW